MKTLVLITCLLTGCTSLFGQYYITGIVRNEHGDILQNVKIQVQSTGLLYYSGMSGEFGITSSRQQDTLVFTTDNYETYSVGVSSKNYQTILLKLLPFAKKLSQNHLISYIKDSAYEEMERWTVADETYSTLVENPFILTKTSPNASFSVNINRASYSNIRRFLKMSEMVPPSGVRIEEMLNNFNLGYQEPDSTDVFKCSSQVSTCPWNSEHQLLFLNISARKVDMHNIPPSNLVFLIDASGSMDLPNKMPLLKAGFQLLVKNLRDIDTVSIVTYGEMVHTLLEGVSGSEKNKISEAIEQIDPDGPTPGENGLRLAYEVVKRRFIKGGNNRIILASDGDFNVGVSAENELEVLIEQQRKAGIYLTCLGFGMGNYKDSKLSVLAQKGNGNFSYIDNEQEAEKILVTELTQTLYVVADNVRLNVQFQNTAVMNYRLIGFDNKKKALADSTSKLEGGEIGSGHSLIALFELIPSSDTFKTSGPLADIMINYQLPGLAAARSFHFTCPYNLLSFDKADSCLKKAASIAMFGMKLRGSPYAAQITWNDIDELSAQSFTSGDFVSTEYLGLIAEARKIYGNKRKKHKFFD